MDFTNISDFLPLEANSNKLLIIVENSTNEKLIRHLKYEVGALKSDRIEAAFKDIDRGFFVPDELSGEAYEDYALPIGNGATISQPSTVAFMLEKLNPKTGDSVLDIGSGSGWTTALIAHIVGQSGRVIGLEIVPELVRSARTNISKLYSNIPRNIGIGNMEIMKTQKDAIRLEARAPFDRILVSAAAKEIPSGLLSQLNINGRMVIPIGEPYDSQSIFVLKKNQDGTINSEEFPGFAFVPLQ